MQALSKSKHCVRISDDPASKLQIMLQIEKPEAKNLGECHIECKQCSITGAYAEGGVGGFKLPPPLDKSKNCGPMIFVA